MHRRLHLWGGFPPPLLHWRPAPRDMRLLHHALLGVSPKGCAHVVIDDPGFVGVVTGRHAEEAKRDKDCMLFKSFEDARRVRSERLAGFRTSLPCPIDDWIASRDGAIQEGFELLVVAD